MDACVCTQGASVFVPVRLLGPSFIFMLTYVWSRNFPTSNVSLMGLVSIQAFYLPFALMALSLAMGGDWISDLLGIVVGHLCAPSLLTACYCACERSEEPGTPEPFQWSSELSRAHNRNQG